MRRIGNLGATSNKLTIGTLGDSPIPTPDNTEYWIHVSSLGLYRIIGVGLQEADKSKVVIYQAAYGGPIWVRAYDQFIDGRFKPVEEKEQSLS